MSNKKIKQKENDIKKPKYYFEVRLDGKLQGKIPYYGHTIWISQKALDIPSDLKEKWKVVINAAPKPQPLVLLLWLEPVVYDKVPELNVGQSLEVEVYAPTTEDRKVIAQTRSVIGVTDEDHFPQVVSLQLIDN